MIIFLLFRCVEAKEHNGDFATESMPRSGFSDYAFFKENAGPISDFSRAFAEPCEIDWRFLRQPSENTVELR
jgi:hypothetical protein